MKTRLVSTIFAFGLLLPLWFTGLTVGYEMTREVSNVPKEPGITVNVSNFKELVRGNTTDGVWSVSWSPDETQLVGGQRNNIAVIYDTTKLNILKNLSGPTDQAFSVAWSPTGDKILGGSWDGKVSIWDATTGALLHTLNGDQSGTGQEVRAVCWSPDGTRAASGGVYDKTVRIWNADTGALLFSLVNHTGAVHSLAWSPDGTILASGSNWQDTSIKLWDPATGTLIRTLNGHTGEVGALDWSKDSKLLLSTEGYKGGTPDKIIHLWDISTGKIISNYTTSMNVYGFFSAKFSFDDSMIAAGTWDISVQQNNVILIWNRTTGNIIKTLTGHSSGVMGISWSPTGLKLASGSLDDTIRIWGESPAPDTTRPTITITSPSDGAILPSTAATVTGTAWDDVAVRKVEISKDAVNWSFCIGKTSWSGNLTLNDGPNTIYAKATDTSENWAIASVNVTVNASDKTKPTVTITYPSNGDTLISKNVTVTGTASDDVSVKKVEITKDGLNWIPCTGTTSWSSDLVLNMGSNKISAKATDTAGNWDTTDVSVLVATIDTMNPTITIIWPTDGTILTTDHVTVRGSASDNVKVEKVHVSRDRTDWTLCAGTTSWYSYFTLIAGENTIYAMATDSSGNWNTTSVSVIADIPDTVKPNITIASPKDGDILASAYVTVNGTASDNNRVQRVEISTDMARWVLCSGTTSWSGNLTLAEGSNTIYAMAVDIAGNEGIVKITVTVHTSAQVVSEYLSWIAALILIIVVLFIVIVILIRRRRRTGTTQVLSFSKYSSAQKAEQIRKNDKT